MARLHSQVKRTVYSAEWTITPIIGAQVQNFLSQKTFLYTAVNPCHWPSHLLSAGYHQWRKGNTWWIQKQDTLVYFKHQPPFILTVWKRATRTFFNIFLFAFHWRTKNMKMSTFFLGEKKIILKAAAPCVIHTKCFYVKKWSSSFAIWLLPVLMKWGQAFLPMNSHSYEKLKSGGWMGSPKHKYNISRNILSGGARGKYYMNHDWLRVGGFPVKMFPRNESKQTHQNEYFITLARESGIGKQELSCKTCHINCRSAKKLT